MAATTAAIEAGKRIRDAREAKGYTQAKLADLMNMGQPNISQIERGKIELTANDGWWIALFLDVSPAWLCFGHPFKRSRA